jgi:hypothetical protein
MWLLLLACHRGDSDTDAAIPQGPPLFAGPGSDGFDADLAALAQGFDRQFLAINAAPYGMSLDVYVRPEHRDAMTTWLATGSGTTTADFEAQTGLAWTDAVYHVDEMGDLGMFGGVAAIADCYRYALVRDDPDALPDDVTTARAAYERVLDALHAMHAMPGTAGGFVRGIARRDQPGMEGVITVPLADDAGDPLPVDKEAVWRDDFSGEYPDYVWYDDTSKDQLDGYILALGAAWDVGHGDPAVDPALLAALSADAAELGHALMVPNPATGLDLTLIDADGRPTTFGDLSASQLEDAVLDEPRNPFNAAIALSTVKVLAEVSGDPELSAFFDTIARDRGYSALIRDVGGIVYLGYLTNYSNVNMGYTAVASLLRFEDDPALRDDDEAALASLWADGTARAPWHFEDAWFSVLQAVYADDDEAAAGAADDLRGFAPAPAFEDAVENCDPEEIATGVCTGIDGVTRIELYGHFDGDVFVPGSSRNASPVATTYVPQPLRPPSNFEWRSDPYRVNGGGSDLLDPRGDWRAAYWAGRYLRRSP